MPLIATRDRRRKKYLEAKRINGICGLLNDRYLRKSGGVSGIPRMSSAEG